MLLSVYLYGMLILAVILFIISLIAQKMKDKKYREELDTIGFGGISMSIILWPISFVMIIINLVKYAKR